MSARKKDWTAALETMYFSADALQTHFKVQAEREKAQLGITHEKVDARVAFIEAIGHERAEEILSITRWVGM